MGRGNVNVATEERWLVFDSLNESEEGQKKTPDSHEPIGGGKGRV